MPIPEAIEIRGTSSSPEPKGSVTISEPSITGLDPIFSSSGANQMEEDKGPKIEELDPIFGINPNTILKGYEDTESKKPEESTLPEDIVAAIPGAFIGSKMGRLAPASQVSQKKYENLQKNAALAESEANVQQEKVAKEQALKSANVNTLMDEMLNANKQVETISKQLEQAKLNLQQYVPETINKQYDPSMSGTRWQEKVVGDLSPAGKSSTESARLYQQTKSMPEWMRSQFQVSNLTNRRGLGLELPTTLDLNYKSPAHIEAEQKVMSLQEAYDDALRKAAEWRLKHEKMSAPGHVTPGESKAMTKAQRAEEVLRRAVEKTEMFKPEEMSLLKKLGYGINKIPGLGILGGGLSAAQFAEGAQRFNKGETIPGVMGMMGGAGGALMAIPNPYTIGAGAILSAPPLIYEAAKYGYPYVKEAITNLNR